MGHPWGSRAARRAVTVGGTWGILSHRSVPPAEHRSVPDVGMLGSFSDRTRSRSQIKIYPHPTPCASVMIPKRSELCITKIRYFQTDFLPCSLQFSTYHWDTICRNFGGFLSWPVEMYVLRNIILSEILNQFWHLRRKKHFILFVKTRQSCICHNLPLKLLFVILK